MSINTLKISEKSPLLYSYIFEILQSNHKTMLKTYLHCLSALLLLGTMPLAANAQKKLTLRSRQEIKIDALVSEDHATLDTKATVIVTTEAKTKMPSDASLIFTIADKNMPGSPSIVSIEREDTSDSDNTSHGYVLTIRRESVKPAPDRDYTSTINFSSKDANYTAEGNMTLRIAPAHTYSASNPFWLEVGANFDLASQKVEANNVFGGIFLYKRELNSWDDRDNFAVAAGVYESKAFSQDYGGAYIPPYYTTSSFPLPGKPNSFLLFNDTGVVKVNRQIRNIGLFFSPQLRLTNGSSNKNGLHMFISLYGELLWQNVQVNYDYTSTYHTSVDTLGMSDIVNYNLRQETRSFNIYSHYDGVGLPIYFKEDNVNLYLNSVLGVTNQPSDAHVKNYLDGTSPLSFLNKKWTAFYLVQFRLSEDRYGFAFSGEIRQLLNSESKPFITLVLSKKFNLSKLIEYAAGNN